MVRAPFVVPCWPPFSEVVLERRALDLPPTRPLTHSRTGPTMAWEDCRKAYLPYIPGWNEWKWSQNGGKAKGSRRPTLAAACLHRGFNSRSSALGDDGNDLTRKERQWFSSCGDREKREAIPQHAVWTWACVRPSFWMTSVMSSTKSLYRECKNQRAPMFDGPSIVWNCPVQSKSG